MRKILLGLLTLSALAFANDRVIDGVVYTETVINGEIKWIKKMVPKTIIVETKKVVMVPAPVTSNIVVVQNSSVNALGKIVTSSTGKIRRVIRRVDRRD